MFLLKPINHIGQYTLFLGQTLRKPEKWNVFGRNILAEIDKVGVDSLGIVTLISLFVGAVITIQTANNLDNPFIPTYTVGFAARECIILEFSPTIICLVLAGKVGSNISSEIGTMRITEQIDALDIMGVNSAGYLAAPKIIAMIISVPLLVIYSIAIGIYGGYLAGKFTGLVPPDDFIYGIHFSLKPHYIPYSLFKSTIFGFIIASISSYCGYYTKGGALEVGKSSTTAVVISSIVILMFNLVITQLILS
ncbi:MAG: ABC transporter permease [Bacteroidales bacterium]|nr:ABC transporter permease [Bacteroidales bacterium]